MKNRRLSRRPLRAAVVALVGAVVLSACGSGGSGKSADDEVENKDLKGAPVKVMTLAQLGSATDNGNEIAQTAKVARNWINAHGGMNGRPLEIIICNDQNDADRAAACARQAVEEKVIAVAGSYTTQGDVIVPLLEKAGIPYVGMCCVGGAFENSSKISFPFNSGAYGLLSGQGILAGEVGCKDPAITDAEGPAAEFKTTMMAKGARAGGAKPKKPVLVNPAGGDYSADVVKIADGADCIMSALSENPTASLLKALQQGGYTGKVTFIGTEGNLTPALTKQFPDVTKGGYNTSFYPPATNKVWDEYWAAWSKYDDPSKFGDKDGVLTGIGALAQWVGLRGMQDIVKDIDGDITAANVIKAFESQTAFDTHGVTPPVDFTKPFTEGKGIERLFNRTITINKLVDGKADWDGKFVDVTPALTAD